jgi:hypothetical protein
LRTATKWIATGGGAKIMRCNHIYGQCRDAGGDNNANKQLIDTLRHLRLFRDYENVFTKATGLALALPLLEY